MVNWVFKVQGCTDLKTINELNEKMFNRSSYMEGDVYSEHFITSHTTFMKEEYGDSPLPFIERIGLSKKNGKKNKK